MQFSLPKYPYPRGLTQRALLWLGCCVLAVSSVVAQGAEQDGISVFVGDSLSLSGMWQFRAGDDSNWSRPELSTPDWELAPIPGRWPGYGYPESGQLGWYRATIKLARGDTLAPALGVRVGRVYSAYELYAGGILVGGLGSLPPSARAHYDQPAVYPIPDAAVGADGTLVLALRVWGGEPALQTGHGGGPYAGQMLLGDYSALMQGHMAADAPLLMLAALLLGFSIYYLFLFLRHPQQRSSLWFAFSAGLMGVYALLLTAWRDELGLPFALLEKLEFASLYLLPAVVLQMVWSLCREPLGVVLRAYQWSFVAAALMVLAVPGLGVLQLTLPLWQLWSLPLLLGVLCFLASRAQRGTSEARWILLPALLFAALLVHDFLVNLAQLDGIRLSPFGFAVVAAAVLVCLGNRQAQALADLESAVQRRTRELETANQQLASAAQTDGLTGALNRRGFMASMAAERQRAKRTGRAFSLVLVDIDYFKQFNDRWGHACGDYVLTRISHLLAQHTRDVDQVARWGGEEFILLLPETNDRGAAVLADKIRQALEDNLFQFNGQRMAVTATFGVASHRQGETLEQTVARADKALYQGKDKGRNCVSVASPARLIAVT